MELLELREAVRRRPGMYFGGFGVPAVERLLTDLISSCVNEFLAGRAAELAVRLTDDSIEVSDDGTGLTLDLGNGDEGAVLSVDALTRCHPSSSAYDHAPRLHHWAGGVDLALAIAVSARARIRSWREGKLWEREFRDGMPLSAPKVVTEGSGRGTTVTLSPDPAIIGASAPRSGLIRAQLFETAHLFSGIVVRFQDEIFHAPNGLADFALIHERLTASEKYSWDARPVFYLQTRLEDVTLAAAALGGTNGVCGWHTWVNGSRTVAPGSHQLGFTEALDKAGWNPAIVMLHIIMREPRYAGSTKDCLESPHVGDLITKGVRGALIEYCRANNVGAAV